MKKENSQAKGKAKKEQRKMSTDFHKSTVYQIYPKSFLDTTGSGVGDLKGITEKLDYLHDLGVDYLWITPFFVSPQVDNGYDVADYYHIDPLFGAMEDLEELIKEAGKRNVGLMLDMVFNHTSDEHEWFQRALRGERKYMDYYYFRKGKGPGLPPNDWDNRVVPGSAWEYVPHMDLWYLHLYDKKQPDLNWENPQVREELKKVVRFWVNKGIKGFRFDVVNLVSKPEGLPDDGVGGGNNGKRLYTDGPRIHEFLHELTADTGIDSLVTVGEMASTSLEHCIRYSRPENKELSMTFSFHHLKTDYKDGKKWELMPNDFMELKKILFTWQQEMQQGGGWNALFWCNHDQPRIVSRYGDDGIYWKESAKMLAMAIHFMRGTPYIYQGEEIGMTNVKNYDRIEDFNDSESRDNYQALLKNGKSPEEALHIIQARSRDNGRTPMQWTGEEALNGGFTSGTPWLKCNSNLSRINVQKQRDDADSIYSFYKKLVQLRKEYKVIAEGTFVPWLEEHPQIFAYQRILDGEDEKQRLLVLCNFSGEEVDAVPIKEQEIFDAVSIQLLAANYQDATEKLPCRLRPYEAAAFIAKPEKY